MLKKTITYTDFNGVERTEDLFFNLSKTELMKMELSEDGSMMAFLNKIVNAKDVPNIMKVFDKILLDSYGEVSDDGRHFRKSPEIRENFKNSQAYDEIFMSFFEENAEKNMADFINGIIPKDLMDKAKGEGLLPAA